MEKFPIGANLESAAARGNERERLDALAEFKNLGRQTDGLRRVVSNDAVFDRHLGFHDELLSKNKTIGAIKCGQDTVEAAVSAARFEYRRYACDYNLPIPRRSGRFGSSFAASRTEQHREDNKNLSTW